MARLFDPLTLRGVRLANRLGVSPMCQYSASGGYATDWHLVHLGGLAQGGAGLVMTEATAVSPEGRISDRDLGLWDDGQVESLLRVTRFIQSQGAVPGIQLAHAGRKASTLPPWAGRASTVPASEGGWVPLGPSPIPFDEGWAEPKAMTERDIQKVLQDFSGAAKRARDAGFLVIEIHAAHGYLLHEFLSPLANRRVDRYGGSFENRCRLTMEVAAAVRNVWPDHLPLFLRISATDWVDDGWGPDESVQLCGRLKGMGIDLIDVSSGGMAPRATIPVEPGYQVPFAQRIRAEARIPTAAVGLITEAKQAQEILEDGKADLVLMGRALLRNPRWPLQAAKELGAEISWPAPYARAALR